MLPQEIIRKKRNKKSLSRRDIQEFIEGVTDEKISDAQIGSMTMAMFLNGLSTEETVDLTLAMRDSGNVLKWHLNGPVIDKHSTGGVGDKVSLIWAPVIAACGGYTPMISGRGLGHTGGTLDKLDAIDGYNTSPSDDLFQKTVESAGCAIIGQTGTLAPADKRMYAVRDVCATVESVPLITASILSKKLAEGLDNLIMDVKFGNGAFMEKVENARLLAQSIVDVANDAGTKTTALLTDMNSVLGYNVGNALEVLECVEYLKGEYVNKRMDEVNKALCAEALIGSKLVKNRQEALLKIEQVLDSGKALEKFAQMVQMLGGPKDFVEKPRNYLPQAPVCRPVFAEKSGFVNKMETRDIGLLLVELKGGRTHPLQKINYATGFSEFCQIGDKVDEKTPLCFVHAMNEDEFSHTARKLKSLIGIGEKPVETKVVLEKIG